MQSFYSDTENSLGRILLHVPIFDRNDVCLLKLPQLMTKTV